MAKITDLSKNRGKWLEVGYFCTEDTEKEILTIVAKFISILDAKEFSNWYNNTHRGITEIIIR